jgi:hypothetical protein
MYRVYETHSGNTSPMSAMGATALGRPIVTGAKVPEPKWCGHNHRSLRAAIKCAKSFGGWNERLGDRGAFVKNETTGDVVFRHAGGMRVTFS